MSIWLDNLVCDEDTEPNLLLLQVKARQIFTMDEIGQHLEDQYLDLMEPLETGLYRPGQIYPEDRNKMKGLKSNKDSSLYYYDLATQRQLPNPGGADQDEQLGHRKEHFLLDKPTVPALGIRLMTAMYEYLLDQMAPYHKRSSGEDRIGSLLKNTINRADFITNELTPAVHDEILDLHKFIGDDTWHIYCTKIYGTSILIEKTVDYRVYDWHRQRHEKRQPIDD